MLRRDVCGADSCMSSVCVANIVAGSVAGLVGGVHLGLPERLRQRLIRQLGIGAVGLARVVARHGLGRASRPCVRPRAALA